MGERCYNAFTTTIPLNKHSGAPIKMKGGITHNNAPIPKNTKPTTRAKVLPKSSMSKKASLNGSIKRDARTWIIAFHTLSWSLARSSRMVSNASIRFSMRSNP